MKAWPPPRPAHGPARRLFRHLFALRTRRRSRRRPAAASRRSPSARHCARIATIAFFGTVAVLNALALPGAEGLAQLHALTLAFALYLLAECLLHIERNDAFGLLSPVFLASFLHFGLASLVGVTGSIFEPAIVGRFGEWLGNVDEALPPAMAVTMLAAFCMWRGYGAGRLLATPVRRSARSSPLVRSRLNPQLAIAVALQALYFGVVLVAIGLGVYGMIGSADARARHVEILEYLRLALAAGTLSLFLILVRYHARHAAGRASLGFGMVCAALVAGHVATGALSGFKSQMVMPFLVAAVARFVATGRVPVSLVAMALLALVAAYQVVEPFRDHIARQGGGLDLASAVGGLAVTMADADPSSQAEHGAPLAPIAMRLDLLGFSATAMAFVDAGHLPPETRRAFQDSLFLAPVIAVVPRAIWPGKPSYSPGVWFNQTVLGRTGDTQTSVAMGPVGYLYMTGGLVAVAVGFLCIGALQAVLFEGIARAGAGGIIVFLSVMAMLVFIPTSLGAAFAGLLRMLPIAFLAQYVILARGSRRYRRAPAAPAGARGRSARMPPVRRAGPGPVRHRMRPG